MDRVGLSHRKCENIFFRQETQRMYILVQCGVYIELNTSCPGSYLQACCILCKWLQHSLRLRASSHISWFHCQLYYTEHLDYTCYCWLFPTFVVDLKSDRSHTLIWLQVKPHLMGHADYQIRNKATGQAGGEGKKKQFLLSCGQQWKDFHLYNQSNAQILSSCR